MTTMAGTGRVRWCSRRVKPAQVQSVWVALAVNALIAAAFAIDFGATFGLAAAALGAPPAVLLALRDRPRAFRTLALALAFVYLTGGLVLFIAGGLAFVLTSVFLFGAALAGRDEHAPPPRAVSPRRARWQLGLFVLAVAIAIALFD